MNTKSYLLYILLFLSSSAYGIDKTFTYSCPDDIAVEVKGAIDSWNHAVNGIFQAKRVDKDATITVKEVRKICGGFRGWTDVESDDHIEIQIVKDCKHRDVVVMHEFGHAFGLGHTKDSNSIMYYKAKDEPILSPDDERRIRRYYGLKAR